MNTCSSRNLMKRLQHSVQRHLEILVNIDCQRVQAVHKVGSFPSTMLQLRNHCEPLIDLGSSPPLLPASSSLVPALLIFHRNSTGCDPATLSGRKHVRLASYVSIGRSPLHFQHPPPHYTSITFLELAIYFCPLRE